MYRHHALPNRQTGTPACTLLLAVLTLLLSTFTGTCVRAQIPLSNLEVWLRPDVNAFTDAAGCINPALENGDNLYCWTSSTESQLKFRRIMDGNLTLRTRTPDTLNGHPSLVMDGTLGLTSPPTDSFAVSAMTIFIVGSNEGVGFSAAVQGTWDQAFTLNATDALHHSRAGAWTRLPHQLDWSDTPHLITSGILGRDEEDIMLYVNGLQSSAAIQEDIIATDYLSLRRAGYVGQRGNNTSVRDGEILEIIVYAGEKLGDARRIITENYLCSKFDISIIAEVDYYSYDGETQGDYDVNVAGVGLDNSDSLNQNNSSELFLTDLSSPGIPTTRYAFIGHRPEANGIITDNLPSGVTERLSRIWALETTGAMEEIGLFFDFSAFDFAEGSPVQDGDYQLLYSETQDFSDLEVVGPATPSLTGRGVRFELAAAQLPNGYYTLGAAQKMVDELVSARYVEKNLELSVSPNPFEHNLRVTIPAQANGAITAEVKLRDLYGRVLLTTTLPFRDEIELSLGSLPVGTYLLEVVVGEQRGVRRVVRR